MIDAVLSLIFVSGAMFSLLNLRQDSPLWKNVLWLGLALACIIMAVAAGIRALMGV